MQCEVNNLREYFAAFGEVVEVQIPCRENGQKRGFGIVQFASVANAATALKQLNATTFLGMCIGFAVINIVSTSFMMFQCAFCVF